MFLQSQNRFIWPLSLLLYGLGGLPKFLKEFKTFMEKKLFIQNRLKMTPKMRQNYSLRISISTKFYGLNESESHYLQFNLVSLSISLYIHNLI